jgi:hypothetical protein
MKRILKSNPLDVHWRTNAEGYEYIMRTIHEMPGVDNLGQAERNLWFKRGWEKKLERLRAKHRAQGLEDYLFLYPEKK